MVWMISSVPDSRLRQAPTNDKNVQISSSVLYIYLHMNMKILLNIFLRIKIVFMKGLCKTMTTTCTFITVLDYTVKLIKLWNRKTTI